MIALALAIQALSPFGPQRDPPEIVRMNQHLALLERAGSEAIVEPLLLCIRAKADGSRPAKGALGNRIEAVKAADTWLAECHGDGARTKLITALREIDGSLDSEAAGRIADTGMGVTMFVTLMLANKTYEIKGPEVAPEPVETPRPQENHAQD